MPSKALIIIAELMLVAEWSQTIDRDIRLDSKGRDHAFFGWARPRSN